MYRYRFKLIGSLKDDNRVVDGVLYSSELDSKDVDGLLSFHVVEPALFEFNGVKAWYTDEPVSEWYNRRVPYFSRAYRELKPEEFFHHSNRCEQWRVLSATHNRDLTLIRNQQRQDEIVATVNNAGGRLWWLKQGNLLRNQFIVRPEVKLFGAPESWNLFRRWPWSRPAAPKNFCGDANTAWHDDSNVEFLSRYKVCVCLENTFSAPHYFTEKFINAARAGCIPVYHATSGAKRDRLVGAQWIDPADFGFDPEKTLAFALKQDVSDFQRANDKWLTTEQVTCSHRDKIWERITQLLCHRIAVKHKAQ